MLDCIIAIVLFKVSIIPAFSSIQETKFEIIAEELSFGVGLQFNFNIPQKNFEKDSQPVSGYPGPSPPTSFGSNERGFEPFVTAETGGRAWPRVL